MFFAAAPQGHGTFDARFAGSARNEDIEPLANQGLQVRLVRFERGHPFAAEPERAVSKPVPRPLLPVQLAQQSGNRTTHGARRVVGRAPLIHPREIGQRIRARHAQAPHSGDRLPRRHPGRRRVGNQHGAALTAIEFGREQRRGAEITALAGRRQVQEVDTPDGLQGEQPGFVLARADQVVVRQFSWPSEPC